MRLAAKSHRFQANNGVLRLEMRWSDVFRVVFHCLWVWKGRTGVSERVYGVERGPWHDKCAGFGVRLAARSHRFQANDGVLRLEMRWTDVIRVVFHCLWVWKGRTGVSERVYGVERGPWHDKCAGFGVRLAARSHRFQPNNGVLRLEMRWTDVIRMFSTAYGYGEGGQM